MEDLYQQYLGEVDRYLQTPSKRKEIENHWKARLDGSVARVRRDAETNASRLANRRKEAVASFARASRALSEKAGGVADVQIPLQMRPKASEGSFAELLQEQGRLCDEINLLLSTWEQDSPQKEALRHRQEQLEAAAKEDSVEQPQPPAEEKRAGCLGVAACVIGLSIAGPLVLRLACGA